MSEMCSKHNCKKVVKEMRVGWAAVTLACPVCEAEEKEELEKTDSQKVIFSSSKGWGSI